jgi:hypothetical protein
MELGYYAPRNGSYMYKEHGTGDISENDRSEGRTLPQE